MGGNQDGEEGGRDITGAMMYIENERLEGRRLRLGTSENEKAK